MGMADYYWEVTLMVKIKQAVEAILLAAVVAGLDQAGTVNVSEVFGLDGDEGALVTGLLVLVLGYLQRWARDELAKADG